MAHLLLSQTRKKGLKPDYIRIVSSHSNPCSPCIRGEPPKGGPPIYLKSGRSLTLSDDNDGATRNELSAMTIFIANSSGLEWTRRSDARAR